jgi:tryptophanyl-tRNA synthetase
MIRHLTPLREKSEELRAKPDHIRQVLGDGAARARAIAGETMKQVRERLGLYQ